MAAVAAVVTLGDMSGSDARAANPQPGFAVDTFTPSVRGSDWFVLDSLDFRDDSRGAVGVVGEYANKPLVVKNGDGSDLASVIAHQLVLHAGASLIILDRLRLSGDLPVTVFTEGKSSATLGGATYTAPDKAAVGDAAIAADVRIFGRYGEVATGAIGVEAIAPTGSRTLYTGEGKSAPRASPRAGRHDHEVRRVGRARRRGVPRRRRRRGRPHTGGSGRLRRIGRLPRRTRQAGRRPRDLRRDVDDRGHRRRIRRSKRSWASFTICSRARGGRGWGSAPGSARGSARRSSERCSRSSSRPPPSATSRRSPRLDTPTTKGRVAVIRIGIPSPTRSTRAPSSRARQNLDDAAVNGCPPSPDHDRDGVADTVDACPDEPGSPNADPELNGCPPDADNDGIPDSEDKCPLRAGTEQPGTEQNGCPPDSDKDGIIDADDACPDVPGAVSRDPQDNGCPIDPDRDHDGILNGADACPNEAGPKDPDPQKNGCPRAILRGAEIRILDQVRFDEGSARITKGKDSDRAARRPSRKVMIAHPGDHERSRSRGTPTIAATRR